MIVCLKWDISAKELTEEYNCRNTKRGVTNAFSYSSYYKLIYKALLLNNPLARRLVLDGIASNYRDSMFPGVELPGVEVITSHYTFFISCQLPGTRYAKRYLKALVVVKSKEP